MKFEQRQRYISSGVRYKAEFDFADQQLSEDVTKISMSLSLTFEEGSQPDDPILLQTTENLIVSETELYENSDGVSRSIEVYVLANAESEKLFVNVPTSNSYRKYHIKIPSIKELEICKDLTEAEEIEPIVEVAKNHYEKEGTWVYYAILEDASKCLGYEGYLSVRDSLVGHEPRLKKTVEADRMASIRNMIIGRSKGKYFKINSSAELWERVSTYNEYPNLEPIEEDELIRYLLKSRYEENYDKLDKSAKWDELRKIIFDPRFVKKYLNIENSDTLEQYFAAYCADLCRFGAIDIINQLMDVRVESSDGLDYETELDRLLESGEYRRYGVRADRFEQLLPEAARRSSHEFKFVAANYLFWRGREYYARPSSSEYPLEIQAFLFAVSEELMAEINGPGSIREQAEYFVHLTEGHLNKFEAHDEAATRYSEAIDIAQNQDTAWMGSRYRYLIPPFRSRAETLAKKFEENEDYAKGNQLLERQIEILEDWNKVEESQQEYAVELLKGLKLELEANEILQSSYIEDSISEVKKKFGRASKHFKQIEREDLQAGALARIKELEAIEAEFHGEFAEAAEAHSDYYEEYPDTSAARYHEQAEVVCLVKESLISGNSQRAKEQMKEMRMNSEYLNKSQQALDTLVKVVYDYYNSSTTDYEAVFEQIIDDSTGGTHLLSVNTDYTIGINQVLAAQRIKENKRISDSLVKKSVRNALIPSDADEYSKEYIENDLPLRRASIGNWKKELPLNVYDKLKSVEADQKHVTDFDNLVTACFVALERLLMAVVEYHCKREWGDNWKIELYDQLYEDPDYGKEITLGSLFGFFYHGPGESVHNSEEIRKQDNTEIFDGITINSMRNKIVHGERLRVANSWEEYEEIRDAIYDLIKTILPVAPRIAKINRILRDEIIFRLLKKQPPHQIRIKYNGALDDEKMYYLPPEIDDEEHETLQGDEIFECENPKGLDEVFKRGV